MDILIDLIVYLIKASAKSRQQRQGIAPANPKGIDQQKAEIEKRIREMQTALKQQTGKVAPAKKPQRLKRPVQQSAAAAMQAPTPVAVAPRWSDPQTTPAVATRRAVPAMTRKSYIVPLLLGEILAPPLALRESEF